MSNQLLDAALDYAKGGLHVFPLHNPVVQPNGDVSCSCSKGSACPNIGKHPRTQHGYNDATTNPEIIRAWWEKSPQANVAIVTGAISGLVVIDIDPRNGGNQSLDELVAKHGKLPDTVEAITGGGGSHLLFNHPGEGFVVKNDSKGKKFGSGIDIKGDGGCIVAPPSLHASRDNYVWELSSQLGEVELAEMPAWLRSRVTEAISVSSVSSDVAASVTSTAPKTLDELFRQTIPSEPGRRNGCILDFARGLKFNLGYEGRPVKELRPLFKQWYEAALRRIGTKSFEVSWFDFRRAWDEAKWPLGIDIAKIAFERAKKKRFPKCVQIYATHPLIQMLISGCCELQRMVGDTVFSLSISQVARLLFGETTDEKELMKYRTTAHRWLTRLTREGILKCVKAGKPGPPGSPASRWRYLGDSKDQ